MWKQTLSSESKPSAADMRLQTGNGQSIQSPLPYHQYRVRMDGSGRATLRNRKFLRIYSPTTPTPPRHTAQDDLRAASPSTTHMLRHNSPHHPGPARTTSRPGSSTDYWSHPWQLLYRFHLPFWTLQERAHPHLRSLPLQACLQRNPPDSVMSGRLPHTTPIEWHLTEKAVCDPTGVNVIFISLQEDLKTWGR